MAIKRSVFEVMDGVETGSVSVGLTSAQLPDKAAERFMICASPSNLGNIFFGDENVTTSTGIALSAGEKSPLMPLDNLNRLYVIGSVASCSLSYIILM